MLLMITMFVGQLIPMMPAMPVPTAHAQAEIIYVNHAATGSNYGISWANAYTDLQTALNAASSGDEIWVAQGTYYPTSGTDRTISFTLKSGVAMYGGFAATETERSERDWETHATILSGDIGTQGNNSDNSYHVIYNDGVTDTAILDGFTITAGYADGGAPDYNGGGMLNSYSNPTLTNVIFSGNSASIGGGMFNYAYSSPTLTNVTFSGNSANQGGGMYNVSFSSPTLTNVIFNGNSADDTGGGISNMNSSSPILTNVTFSGNKASNYGGGMYNWYSSNPTLTNVTFSGNSAVEGGGIYNRDNSNPTIQNSILWGNTATTRGDQIYSGTPVINHTLIQGSGGSGAGWDTTLGTDNGNNLDIDPLFVNPIAASEAPTTDGDYRLQAGSPAINVGDNNLLPTGVTTDGDGNTRILEDTIDLGAYEWRRPIYVDIDASGSKNGTSWANAYTDLLVALTAASSGDEIWVAQGTYYPTSGTDRTISFALKDGVAVYGGFAGNETSRGERDWEANETILSGDIGTQDDNNDNSYHVIYNDGVSATAILNGFIVTAGNADGSNPHDSGGGMYNTTSNTTLTNVTFSGNSASSGGGMYSYSSNTTLTNVTFSGNSATSGGGMYIYVSIPTLTNVTFSGNSADGDGGGMYSYHLSPTLTNVTFGGNSADRGGGMYNLAGSPTLTNITFSGNSAGTGGGVYNGTGSNTHIQNSILWGNTGGQIYNSNLYSGTPVTSYSLIAGSGGSGSWYTSLGKDGGNNLDIDPLFVNPIAATSAPTTTGDYRLQAGSPAIDVGDNSLLPTGVTTDLDGNTRIVNGTVDLGAYEDGESAVTYTIAGTVIDNNGDPLAGVTISTDGGSHTATTNGNGTYTITGLLTNTYTIQAEKFGYTFTPATRLVSVPPDATGKKFTATPSTANLSGKVTSEDGSPISGVEIALTNGMTTTTGSDGSYTFSKLPKGTYTIQAEKFGYTFTPATREVSVPPDANGQDFTAIPMEYTVNGTVLDEAGKPLASVAIETDDGHKATTNANGTYTLTNVLSGTYTLTPTLKGYTFEPASRTVTVPPSKTAQDFTATLKPYTVSGTVLDEAGNPLASVSIETDDGHKATTNANGTYTLTNLISGTYTFTPTLEGYTFDPASITISVPPSKTKQDFTAIPMEYTVSGTVLDEADNPLASVSIETDDGHKATTNSNGTYTLTNVLSGTYTFTPTLDGYTFEPASHTVTVPPDATEQDFTATLKPYTVSGTVLDSDSNPLPNVLVTLNDGRTATTSENGIYTLTNVLSGTYTLTPTLESYTFEPASRSVTVPPAATAQDFTASLRMDRFVVDRDGFSFDNFRYTGARWEDFKRAFPDTQMELPNGTPRKGPQRYFYDRYYHIGDGGNCAGFTAVSLIRFLQLEEGIETELLSTEHRSISPLYDMPDPGKSPFSPRSSDIADYIHLYQARQMSWQYNQWWFAQGHNDDTVQEVFQGVQEYTERNEPVAVDVFQADKGGHRMTAYRTERQGTMGYIYVYDNNWPDDDNRRIEVDLTAGRWSYTLSPRAGMTWSGTQPSTLRYAPASLNFPASLPYWHATDTMLNADVVTGTHLSVDGDATLMISDNQGRKLGFAGDTLVSEIPGAGYLPTDGFNVNNPDAPQTGTYFVPSGSEYTASIEPTASGSYTLTAYANGSAMSLDNIATTQGNNDTVKLANGVQDVTVETTTDTDYCQYVTLEVSETVSRDYTSCVTEASDVRFSLDTGDGELSVSNNGTQDIGVNVTVDQIGDDAHNGSVTKTVGAGEETTVPPTSETVYVYLPYVGK